MAIVLLKIILIAIELVFGWLYPAYQTFYFTSRKYRELHKNNIQELKQWGFYWIIFALLNYLWYLTGIIPETFDDIIQIGRVIFIVCLVIPRMQLAYKLCTIFKDDPRTFARMKGALRSIAKNKTVANAVMAGFLKKTQDAKAKATAEARE